jgi:hypothetical protein
MLEKSMYLRYRLEQHSLWYRLEQHNLCLWYS